MARKRIPDVFHPGEFIRDELKARGWTQKHLAKMLPMSECQLSDLIAGKRNVTAKRAWQLADAFGGNPETWMNLQTAYSIGMEKRRRHKNQ